MTSKKMEVGLWLGRGMAAPANATVMQAFRSAEVQIREEAPSMFSLTFQAARNTSTQDYDLLLLPYLQPFNRVILTVTVLGVPYVIMDGLITRQHLAPGAAPNPDTITVSGQDVSVAMSLEQQSVPWPAMADFEIVELILAKYAMYGLVPVVIPTLSSFSTMPLEVTAQQTSDDFSYIRELAGRHGYLFKLIPGPTPGVNTAYWGPPNRAGAPMPTLNVGVAPERNVEQIAFDYDGMAPSTYVGTVLDEEDDTTTPVAALVSTRMPPLAAEPAMVVNQPWVRMGLMKSSRLDVIQAEAQLQGMADRSADDVVTGTGTIDVLRYGSLLAAPGIVGVRGAGLAYDGLYYLKEVSHKITPERYTQDFTITREGLMTTVPAVIP